MSLREKIGKFFDERVPTPNRGRVKEHSAYLAKAKPFATFSARVWRAAEKKWYDLGVIADHIRINKEDK